MKFKIIYSQSSYKDLQSIYNYIFYTLKEPNIAKKQIKRILDTINSLESMPMRHRIYFDEPWKSQNIRFITVNKYIVFYKVNDENFNVHIIRIMFGGQNLSNRIGDT